MKVPSKVIIPVAAIGLLSAGFYGVSNVSAASKTSSRPKTLAQEVASSLNVDESKVQSVITKHRSEVSDFRESNYESRLAKAVTDGKLTAAQQTAILAEHKKLIGELQSAAQLKQGDARRQAMKQVHDEAKTWATQNNVSVSWLLRGGPGGGRGTTPTSTASPSASPQA